jgi:hypothetical protein
MSFIPVPQCVLARLKFVTGLTYLEASLNIWFQRAEFGKSEMEALNADLESDLITDLMLCLTNPCKAVGITTYDMRAEDGIKVESTFEISGTGGELPLSPATCCLITFGNDQRGRWGRGRLYVPGLDEEWCDELDITALNADAILAAFQQNLLTSPPSGWTWVVVSRRHNKQPRTEGVYSPVTWAKLRNYRFAFQRRRAQRS